MRSWYRIGAVQASLSDLVSHRVNLAAVQETRWLASGVHAFPTHTFYFSGGDGNNHQFGTGFVLDKKLDLMVVKFNPINKYMCTIRLRLKKRFLTLINAHAPTEVKEESIKEEFYSKLEQTYDSIPGYDIKIVLGDFNAQVGRDPTVWSVAGCHSLHEQSNDNGTRLVEFAASKNLIIKSTSFMRKNIYKATWYSNDRKRSSSQIDHVLVDGRHSSSILNVHSARGTSHDSDHELVIARLRMRLASAPRRCSNSNRVKFNTTCLKTQAMKEKFEEKVASTLLDTGRDFDNLSINDQVRETTSVVLNAADEVLGRERRAKIKSWFDEECKAKVEERRCARIKAKQLRTRRSEAEFRAKSVEVYRFLRHKKREKYNNEIEEMESNMSINNTRDFYKTVKQYKKGFQPHANKILDRSGELLSDKGSRLARWKEYFQELLEPTEVPEVVGGEFATVDPEIDDPSYEEVVEAIHELKNNKAAGADNVAGELLRHGGPDLWERLHNIISRIWREETLPDDWKIGLLVPIHKKGSKQVCDNYRGISLLSVPYKVLSKVIYKRLVPVVEALVGDYQCGFRASRSTIDQIFTVRQILEKAYEYQITIHQIFVDFKKAYDSISREALWQAMREFHIPSKLIRLTQMTMAGSTYQVLSENNLSDPFEVSGGLRQGDCLSTVLFNIALEKVIRALDVNFGGTILNSGKQILAFADDIDLISRGRRDANGIFGELERSARRVGLEINEDKSKYLTLDRKHGGRSSQNVTIGEYNLEGVPSFKYLGSIINANNDIEEEIKSRIIAGNKCFFALKSLLKSRILSKKSKIKIYTTAIRPIVTYGSETWTVTKRNEENLLKFERRIIRSIQGPIRVSDTEWRLATNNEVYAFFGHDDIACVMRRNRLRWWGHLMRMSDDRAAKRVYSTNVIGDRARGRPRLRWRDQVMDDLRTLGITNGRVVAMDRHRWRSLIRGQAMTHRGS